MHAEMSKLHACYTVIYLHAVLLYAHKQTHVYARQALNRSINMCYEMVHVYKFLANKFLYSMSCARIFPGRK